jgi:general secretion pathway protein C
MWIVVAPMAPFVAPPAAARVEEAKLASLTRVNPFLPRQPASAASMLAGSDVRGLTLFGIRAGGKDGGAAILGAAGKPQAVYALGDEVAPGTVLKEIAADHVVLARGGRELLLPFADAPTSAGGAAVPSYLTSRPRAEPQAQRSSPVAVDAKKLLEETGLRPRTDNGKVTGYIVLPKGGAETLRRAGLEAGDVLVGLNGSPISPELYSQLEHELVSGPQVQLTVQRGTQTRTITLETGR